MFRHILALLIFLAAPVLPSEGTLRVGTSGDYPPFSRGSQGFDLDVARMLAEDFDAELIWVPFTWPTLTSQVQAGDFDVAMGGITWRAQRAVHGQMSRAVAQGAPCVVGDQTPEAVAVNRGGILERFARERFGGEVVTTEDNLELPELLTSGQVDAFVTDSFEVAHFAGTNHYTCEPPRDRKVYWFAAGRDDLARRVDAWLETNESRIAELRQQHFGHKLPRTAEHNLVDLMARRFAFMPHVARYKSLHGIAITDLEQEARILAGAESAAKQRGLDVGATRTLFETLIDLAKAIQQRTPAGEPSLDLTTEIRPALVRLTPKLLDALGSGFTVAALDTQELRAPLEGWLDAVEVDRLYQALAAFE